MRKMEKEEIWYSYYLYIEKIYLELYRKVRFSFLVLYTIISVVFYKKYCIKNYFRKVRKMTFWDSELEIIGKENLHIIYNENNKGNGVILMMNHNMLFDNSFLNDYLDFFTIS